MFKFISEFPNLPKMKTSEDISSDKIHGEFDKIDWNSGFQLAEKIFDNSSSSTINNIPYFSITNTETEHELVLSIARNDKLEPKILAMHNWQTKKSSFWGLFKSNQNNGSARLLRDKIETREVIDLFLESKYNELDSRLKDQVH